MSVFVKMFYVTDLSREFAAWMRGEIEESEFLRFGQYICNKYLKEGAVCPSIFYEESDAHAFEKIYRELNRD